MELYLQFGAMMMEHCRFLLNEWQGGTVILSPRDQDADQIRRFSNDIVGIPNANTLFDPQFYLPRCDHTRLNSHKYWPKDYDSGSYLYPPVQKKLLRELYKYNRDLSCKWFILPGLLCSKVNGLWSKFHKGIYENSANFDLPRVPTLALEASVVLDSDQIHEILQMVEDWDVLGFYLVFEHPNGKYLVNEPLWISNILDICSGLRLMKKKVILGYCNQQMLIASTAAVNAICSGTWMNVRSFFPEKFYMDYQNEIKQRSTWIYCPQALSEFQLPFLDMAWKRGVLNKIKAPDECGSPYIDNLFDGPQPTTLEISEREAFRHYLQCLKVQVGQSKLQTFEDTVKNHYDLLDGAEALLSILRKNGVRGKDRDFYEIIESNRSALDVHTVSRGPMLKRKWKSL